MGWINQDLELELNQSPLSLNDLVAPNSIKTLTVNNRQLKHIRDGKQIRIDLSSFNNVVEFDMSCADGFRRLYQ